MGPFVTLACGRPGCPASHSGYYGTRGAALARAGAEGLLFVGAGGRVRCWRCRAGELAAALAALGASDLAGDAVEAALGERRAVPGEPDR